MQPLLTIDRHSSFFLDSRFRHREFRHREFRHREFRHRNKRRRNTTSNVVVVDFKDLEFQFSLRNGDFDLIANFFADKSLSNRAGQTKCGDTIYKVSLVASPQLAAPLSWC